MWKFLSLVLFVSSALATHEEERMIGGQNATIFQFPHQARLHFEQRSNQLCGGSIISYRFVLTVAHCTIGRWAIPVNVQVVVGPLHNGTRYALDTIVNHPNYEAHTLENDISVLRTTKTIAFSYFVQSIALPKYDAAGNLPVTVTGWGKFKLGCFNFSLFFFVPISLIQKMYIKNFRLALMPIQRFIQ